MRPLRRVLDDPPPLVRAGRGGLLGPDTSRRVRWWEVRLDCGHVAEVPARYGPRTDGRRPGSPRRRSDMLPPPKRARCERCPER